MPGPNTPSKDGGLLPRVSFRQLIKLSYLNESILEMTFRQQRKWGRSPWLLPTSPVRPQKEGRERERERDGGQGENKT